MMKSLRSTGSFTASRTAWMYSSLPWKNFSSVRTLRASAPASAGVAEIAGWTVLILLLPGLAAAVYLRVYRPARVAGPLRIPPGRSVWPFVCVWLAGGAVWMGSSTAYVAFKQYQLMTVAGP